MYFPRGVIISLSITQPCLWFLPLAPWSSVWLLAAFEKDMTQLPVSTVLVGEELTEKVGAVVGGEP